MSLLLRLFTLVLLTALLALPAAAQCNPSYDQNCPPPGEDLAPDVGFSPNGGTYTVAAGSSQSFTVTVTFSDSDGLRQDTMKVELWTAGVPRTVTGFTWTPGHNATFGTARGVLNLTAAGEHVLTAEIADLTGKVGKGRTTFTLANPDPSVPVVSLAPHHNDYRLTALGAQTLTHGLPAYVSMDTSRSVGLYYNSQHADPTGFVQLDVDTGSDASGSLVKAVTLQIFDENDQPVTTRDTWMKPPSGKQRVGAQWSMRDRVSGAYTYTAEVRGYREDKINYQPTRVQFRVLVINDRHSRFGAGWSFAGVQRLYPKSAGLMVSEGNGVARYFEKVSCDAVSCSFRTPAGDFSTIRYDHSLPGYVRTYLDGTKITFSVDGVMISVANRFGIRVRYDWVKVADDPRPPAWLLTVVTDPTGRYTYTEYYDGYLDAIIDPAGRRLDLTYESSGTGNLLNIAGPVTLALRYDSANRVTSYTDWNGTWDVAYDERGTVRQVTAPAVIVGSSTSVRPAVTYQSLQSLTVLTPWATDICCNAAAAVPTDVMVSVTDPLGHATSMTLNRYGDPTRILGIDGRTITNSYDEDGLLTHSSDDMQTQRIVQTWNERGQLLSRSVNESTVYSASYGAGDQPEFVMSGSTALWYSYGPRGEVTRTWYGAQDDATRNGTTYQYDDYFRPIVTIGPKGERMEWAYNDPSWNTSEVRQVREDNTRLTTTITYDSTGRPLTVTNPLGHSTTTTYDALNRPVKVTDPRQLFGRFSYTGPNLTNVIDKAGKNHSYKYNALGWLTSESFPDGKNRFYRYNADGMITNSIDRRGASANVVFGYDDKHRLVQRGADGVSTKYSYPDFYTVHMTNGEAAETVRLHPENGRLHKVTTTIGGPASSHSYEVERLLDRTSGWSLFGVDVKRYQGTGVVRTDSIRYTPEDRPLDTSFSSALAVKDMSGNTTTLGFDASGRPAKTIFPNGVTQTNYFTTDGRLGGTSFSPATVDVALGAGYTYDLISRSGTRTSWSGNERWLYGYDAFGQVAEYQMAEWTTFDNCNPSYEICDTGWVTKRFASYTYDAAGNRTDAGGAVSPQSNRYVQFNGYTLGYDLEGNLTSKTKPGFSQTLTWNSLQQLTSVTTNGVTVTYGYSPSGKRLRRTQGAQVTYYVYDDDDLAMEVDANGNPLRAYTHWPGVDLPLSVKVTSGGQESVYYYTMEAPGHVTGLLNSGGGVAGQYKYEPFGAIESSSDSTGQPLRYMARELDSSTGLYYVRARWYDPALARFISEDPIGLAGGMNTYAYVENDPVNRRDPSGLTDGYYCYAFFTGWIAATVQCAPVRFYNFGAGFGDRGNILGLQREAMFNDLVVGRATDEVSPSPETADYGPYGLPRPDTPRFGGGIKTHSQCFDEMISVDGQVGAFASAEANAGVFGASITVDLGSMHAMIDNGQTSVAQTSGVYGDVKVFGWTIPVGFKKTTTGGRTERMRWAGKPTFGSFPVGGGGGVGAGGTINANLAKMPTGVAIENGRCSG
jgi:RHS repeat-associated protein